MIQLYHPLSSNCIHFQSPQVNYLDKIFSPFFPLIYFFQATAYVMMPLIFQGQNNRIVVRKLNKMNHSDDLLHYLVIIPPSHVYIACTAEMQCVIAKSEFTKWQVQNGSLPKTRFKQLQLTGLSMRAGTDSRFGSASGQIGP